MNVSDAFVAENFFCLKNEQLLKKGQDDNLVTTNQDQCESKVKMNGLMLVAEILDSY